MFRSAQLRRHARASSAALHAARDEIQHLNAQLQRAGREKAALRRQVDELRRATLDLSQDLDEASVRMTLADGAARGRSWAAQAYVGDPHSSSSAYGRYEAEDTSYDGPDTELEAALQEAPGARRQPSRAEGMDVPEEAPSELSQLDRDIQTLKASLRAMLGSSYMSSGPGVGY